VRDDAVVRAEAERAALRARHPEIFNDGARFGYLGRAAGARKRGGYPLGFHELELDARNAWFAGWNQGRTDRKAGQ
jgi:hypothetical protein